MGDSRRKFIRTAAAAGGAAALFACRGEDGEADRAAPAVHTAKKRRWKMVTTWPPHFPVLGLGAELLARRVGELSGGQLTVKVYGAGELVPAMETFEAVRRGAAEMGHGAAYYWAGKIPAAQFFTAVPFGMNAQQMNAWIHGGGALELWQKLYAPHYLVPMPAGNTGVQMGGWFNREINGIADLKGLKMRIPGLGGQVITSAGGSAILSPGGEIYTNLERGVIDATEWVGPYHDYLMGFHKIAKYYYYPGWHEPGSVMELIVNKKRFDSLPAHLRQVIRTAAAEVNAWILDEFEFQNSAYLKKLRDEEKVDIRPFPPDVLSSFRRLSQEVVEAVAASDSQAAEIHSSFKRFREQIGGWAGISEAVWHRLSATGSS